MVDHGENTPSASYCANRLGGCAGNIDVFAGKRRKYAMVVGATWF